MTDNDTFIFNPTEEPDGIRIEKGDVVAFERYFSPKGNDIIEANSLDNRIGCSVLLDIMKNVMSDIPEAATFVFVFSTKEETDRSDFSDVIRCYGGDFAIVVDAAYAQPVEFDLTKDLEIEIPILGDGCAMQISGKGFKIEEKIIHEVVNTAISEGIKLQRENAPVGFGKTNFAKMLLQGVKAGAVINVPVRDQHQQFSSVSITDAEEAVLLIGALLKRAGKLGELL